MRQKKPVGRQVSNSLMMVMQFGLNMLVPMLLLMFIGIRLDDHFGTSWIAITLFFVGAVAGFQNVYRMAKSAMGLTKKSEETLPKEKEQDDTEN